ncbi:MAG: hypothetical protein CMJ46_02805 [Planctomyces sp.]|nr:hypothetical protein [Planctomyces sp.]
MRRLFKWKRTWILLAACALFFGSYAFWRSGRGDMVIREPGTYTATESDWLDKIEITSVDDELQLTVQEQTRALGIDYKPSLSGPPKMEMYEMGWWHYPASWNPLAPSQMVELAPRKQTTFAPTAGWEVFVDESAETVTAKTSEVIWTYDSSESIVTETMTRRNQSAP